MEEKKNKTNYLLYAIILVVVLIVATVAVTYAYYKISTDFDTQLSNVNTSLECIDLSLSDNGTSIGLSHNYPITDSLAMTSGSVEPLEVTVTNNCSNEVKYSLALSTLALTADEDKYIEDNKIRYKVLKNDADHKGIDYLSSMPKIASTSKLYSDLTGENGELATKYADYTLKQIYSIDDLVTLGVNSSNTYDIYMWVDYYEGDAAMYESADAVHNEEYDRTTEGKKFAAAISLSFNTGEANEYPLFGEYLLDNPTLGLNTTMEGGLYRYTGTDVDNYICFGTIDKNECTSSPDTYMYRIIGVTGEANSTLGIEVNQLKLIKSTTMGNYNWHTSYTTDTKWEDSAMYTYLQGADVLGNTIIIPSGWSNKIDSVKWYVGDVYTTSPTNGTTVIGLEDDTMTSSTSKIGLMYLSDYFYAYNTGGTQNCFSTACKSWMTDATNNTWPMTRYGYNTDTGYYNSWYIHATGVIGRYPLHYEFSVRPVFYLNSDEVYVSGNGTIEEPFIIG